MVLARWLRWPSTVSRVPDTRRSSRAFGSTWPYPAGWFSDWPERAWMERSKGRHESAGDAPNFSQICINTAEQMLQRWHRVALDNIVDPDDRGALDEEWTQLVTDLQRCASGVQGVAGGRQLYTVAKLIHQLDRLPSERTVRRYTFTLWSQHTSVLRSMRIPAPHTPPRRGSSLASTDTP